MKRWTLILLMISTLASGQSGYNYYMRADRVGSKNEKAFAYLKKAYYDHIWNWTKTGSDSAVYYLQMAIKEDSLYGAAYAFLGHVYKFKLYDGRDKDEFKNQKWYAEKAIKLNPKLGDAYTLMGTVKWTEGDTASAFKYLRQAIKIEPDHLGNYFWLAWRLATVPQKKDSAIYYFHKMIRMDPQYGQSYMKLAAIYDGYGVYDSSVFYYKKAISHYENVKPRDLRMINGYLYAAIILKDQSKNYDLAEDYLKTFLHEVKETDFMVKEQSLMTGYGMLADCYKKMSERETQKLIDHNEKFVKANPNDHDRIFQVVDSYLPLDNDSINLKYVLPLTKRLYSLAPTEEEKKIDILLHIDVLKKINLEDAINQLNDLTKKYPNDFLVILENGALYARKGNDKKSLNFLNQARKLAKSDYDRLVFKAKLDEKDFDKLRVNKDFKKLKE